MPNAAAYVLQTTTSTGTGELTLAPVTGRRTFANALPGSSSTERFYYNVYDEATGDLEEGEGYLSVGGGLVRDNANVISSTNGGNLVNFAAGTKLVSCDIPAARQAAAIYNPTIDE